MKEEPLVSASLFPALTWAARLRAWARTETAQVLGLFLVVKGTLYFFAAIAFVWVPRDQRAHPFTPLLDIPWLKFWQQWDVGGYIGIAERGYRPGSDIAGFFPLAPWLALLVKPFVGNIMLAGLIVSNLAMLGAVILLYRLTKLEFGEPDVALRSVWYLLIYPSAFYTSTFYSEPVYLLTAIASFYLLRQQRWLLAGVAGALASLSRFIGIVLAPTLFLAYALDRWKRRAGLDWGALGFLLVPLGFVVYGVVLQAQMGDPLAFMKAGTEFFGRTNVPPWVSLQFAIDTVQGKNVHPDFPENWATNFINLSSLLLFLLMSYFVFKKLGLAYGTYVLLGLLVPLSTSHLGDRALAGMVRYNLVLFPVFMVLGLYGRNRFLDRFLTTVFILFLGLLTAFFIREWNVAGVS